MAGIVLDTDVVSLYRVGRLPAGFAIRVATNELSIAFATAGELWSGATRATPAAERHLDRGLLH